MTLPQNVKDALESADANSGLALVYMERDDYNTIRAHLMSQAAEIDRLRGITPELPPMPPDGVGLPRYGLRWNGPQLPLATPMGDGYWTPWHLAESLLAAANALLRECHCYFEARGVDSRTIGEPLSLNEKIQTHLQGAGDEA